MGTGFDVVNPFTAKGSPLTYKSSGVRQSNIISALSAPTAVKALMGT